MDPNPSAPAGTTRPLLSTLFHTRKQQCREKLKEATNLLDLLALLQEFLEVAPVLAFEKFRMERRGVPENVTDVTEGYWFNLSLPVVKGNDALLTYLLDPRKYRHDMGIQEFMIQSDGDYVVATLFAPGDAPEPDAKRKKVLLNLSLNHLRLRCDWVAQEVDLYNEAIRYLFHPFPK
jgi:hypothetical protein